MSDFDSNTSTPKQPTAAQRAVDTGTQIQLPRYQCHKRVCAIKIDQIVDPTKPGNESDGSRILVGDRARMPVDHAFMCKHKPQVGGYLVIYDDGYKSFSPAKAFEEGYTRI